MAQKGAGQGAGSRLVHAQGVFERSAVLAVHLHHALVLHVAHQRVQQVRKAVVPGILYVLARGGVRQVVVLGHFADAAVVVAASGAGLQLGGLARQKWTPTSSFFLVV